MKIICAVDFSEPSLQAVRVAARFAQRFGDELLLVNVWSSPFTFYRELIGDPRAVEEKMVAKSSADLEEIARPLRSVDLKVERQILSSPHTAEAIVALGKEVNARMLIVGSRGGHGAKKLFIGSVAERTMLLSDRPVLVVHSGPSSLEEWAEGRRALRVVVGLDHSAASLAAVDWVRNLRALGPCDVTFLHAFWPLEQYSRLGVHGAVNIAVGDEETRRVLERELRPLFSDLPGAGTVALKLKPVWGPAVETIVEETKVSQADLLVMGTNQRGPLGRLWAGATVQPTVRMAELPVLCVPASQKHHAAAGTPARIRKILVATDFSELGNRAVAYAFDLARGGGTVTLCHVHERPLPVPAYAYPDDRGALDPGQRLEVEKQLRALVPPEATDQGVSSEVVIVDGGHAATGIFQEANRLGVDAICLGSHGRSGLSRALLGSVAEAVTRRAERPVLVVRPGT